jgi:hypothetical protein
MLGLVAAGLLGTGLYDWLHQGIADHTGRAVFFGLMLVAIYWGALVYIFKLSMCVLVGPRGLSLVRGPWRTELFWRDTARLVERTETEGGQRFRWVVAMARDGRELRVREDMVTDYVRFRAEVYERYLLWRDHGGTWGASGSGPFKATDIVANVVTWWLFGAGMLVLPGLYFWFLLPETDLTGLVLIGLAALCCLQAFFTFLGRQSYTVSPKEITRKRPIRPMTHLRWRNVSRIDRARHPAGGLIRIAIAIGRLLMAIAARTDSRFKSFAWSPRVPEYLTLRGEGRHVRIRLHRLLRPDEMLAWVEYYERIGRRGESNLSQPRPGSASQPAVASRPMSPSAPTPAGAMAGENFLNDGDDFGPMDPWANGRSGDLPADAYPTELQPAIGGLRPSMRPAPATPTAPNQPMDVPPSVAAAYGAAIEDERSEEDSWLWDTSKMPKVSRTPSSPDIFQPAAQSQPPRQNPRQSPQVTPAFTPPPTAGPAFTPPTGDAAAEKPWWMMNDAPAQQPPQATPSWEAGDVYPPVNYQNAPSVPNPPNAPFMPNMPPAPEYPAAYPPPDEDEQPTYTEANYGQLASPPFVQRPDYPNQPYTEPPEEQGPSEREMYDENLAQSQRWRNQQNWQPPQLPRFGPQHDEDQDKR